MGSLAVVPNEELIQVLEDIGLSHVAERIGDGDALQGLCEVELDRTKRLSLGEQQRLAFGRLLVHPAELAVLDESTSALDCAMEERPYRLLANNKTTTYISVSHRQFPVRDIRIRRFRCAMAQLGPAGTHKQYTTPCSVEYGCPPACLMEP